MFKNRKRRTESGRRRNKIQEMRERRQKGFDGAEMVVWEDT